MKIAIIGTRGVPNFHGGFEQFAEYFSLYLVKKGHEVVVYNSSAHPFKNRIFKGVEIIHRNDPEKKLGAIGQFIYDFNCILDSRKRKFNIILQLGYTSSSIWHWLLPKSAIIITNMDGLEWKRDKYSFFAKLYLKYAEKLAVRTSDYLIADSKGIKDYLLKKYSVDSKYIPYGADVVSKPNVNTLKKYDLYEYEYDMLIARLEPENNIETILNGVVSSAIKRKFIVVGDYNKTNHGKYLKVKFKKHKNIHFLGSIYDIDDLNDLRFFSNLYFHGHSVGGTNPSLLEAMASSSLIIAHDNIFNYSILGSDAFYFSSKNHVMQHITNTTKNMHKEKILNNTRKIAYKYNWEKINNQYLKHFLLKSS